MALKASGHFDLICLQIQSLLLSRGDGPNSPANGTNNNKVPVWKEGWWLLRGRNINEAMCFQFLPVGGSNWAEQANPGFVPLKWIEALSAEFIQSIHVKYWARYIFNCGWANSYNLVKGALNLIRFGFWSCWQLVYVLHIFESAVLHVWGLCELYW